MSPHRHPAAGIASIVLVALILYLTLAPRPLPEDTPPLFPGADKLGHAAMFGLLTLTLLLDYRLMRHRLPSLRAALTSAAAASVLGGIIELLQQAMALGRTAEWGDFAADIAGAFAAALLYAAILRFRRN